MADLTVPKADYGYAIAFTVQDSTGTAYNLTGYTVTLRVWEEYLNTPKSLFTGACTITVAASGTCSYSVASGNFPSVGTYKAELELTKTSVVESTASFTIEVKESS